VEWRRRDIVAELGMVLHSARRGALNGDAARRSAFFRRVQHHHTLRRGEVRRAKVGEGVTTVEP